MTDLLARANVSPQEIAELLDQVNADLKAAQRQLSDAAKRLKELTKAADAIQVLLDMQPEQTEG